MAIDKICNEDYDSPDRVPYAGALGKGAAGMCVATGFNGRGISNGTTAACTHMGCTVTWNKPS